MTEKEKEETVYIAVGGFHFVDRSHYAVEKMKTQTEHLEQKLLQADILELRTGCLAPLTSLFMPSACIKFLQYVTGTGLFGFNDVFSNTLGGLIGFVLAMIAVKAFPKMKDVWTTRKK